MTSGSTICPGCGTNNAPSDTECIAFGAPLRQDRVQGHFLRQGVCDIVCPNCGEPKPPIFYGPMYAVSGEKLPATEGAIVRCSRCERRAGILAFTQDIAQAAAQKMFLENPIFPGKPMQNLG